MQQVEEIFISGAFLLNLKVRCDERGSFTRLFCQKSLEELHITSSPIIQSGLSFNPLKGTLRGMHYQLAPKAQEKWVLCTKGKIYDVIIDLRTESLTFKKAYGVALEANNPRLLFIPKGCAHGFITLEDQSEVLYQMAEHQYPHYERVIRWNDPNFNIQWPIEPKIISQRDANQFDFDPAYHLKEDI